ncbi:MAG: hypothetical protein WAT20_01715, partial [Ferruginibacter sp.]
VQVSAQADEGFIRTIDVILTMGTSVNDSIKNEIDNLCRELEFILDGNASPVTPFQIIIKNSP